MEYLNEQKTNLNNTWNYNNHINKETYFKISPFFNCLCHTISRANSGKYYLTKKDAKNGFKSMNTYYNSILSIKAIELLKHDAGLYYKFVEYIKANHTIIRFNQIGDFKNETDYHLLINLTLDCPNTVFYGYSARDDILNGYNESTNLFINGSNKQYTNRFQTTTNIKQHLNNPLKCIGDCINCKKCYTLRGQTISCLLHGPLKNIDKYFNNEPNRQFLKEFFNSNFNHLNLSDDDLKTHAGLLDSLNKAFKNSTYSTWNFKDYKELLNYIKTMGWD